MSQNPSTTYRNTHPVLPDSDEDNQVNLSPQSSSPSPPSSEEFTSDPARYHIPSTSEVVPTTLDTVLPSTALEFNFPRITTEPTPSFIKPPPKEEPTIIHRTTTTNPALTPPNSTQT